MKSKQASYALSRMLTFDMKIGLVVWQFNICNLVQESDSCSDALLL